MITLSGSSSRLFLFLILVTILLVVSGVLYWESIKIHHEHPSDFDRDTWLLTGLSIAAIVSLGSFILYIFFMR